MSIYKDNVTGKWRVVYRYTDWTGKTKQTSKRGFPTKREAQMWEHEQMLKHDAKLDMTFASFYEIYVEDKKERIRDNTWGTKNNIARTKILPYFGERKIAEIEPKDVIAWQNHLLAFKRANGKGYSASYLRKIHSQLSAIFNHAVDFYHLPSNPAQKAGNIAIEEYKEKYTEFVDGIYTLTTVGENYLNTRIDELNYFFSQKFIYDDTLTVATNIADSGKEIFVYDENIIVDEGKVEKKMSKSRVRSRALRDAAIDYYSSEGIIRCVVCGFSYEEKYGEIGKGYLLRYWPVLDRTDYRLACYG